MPPEQIRGERVDARADVYSLGCVMFHSLTGHVPYERDSEVAKIFAHLTDPPPSVAEHAPEAPPPLDTVVTEALAKAPDDRYPSAGDLARAARAALTEAVPAEREHSVATGQRPPAPPCRPPPGLRCPPRCRARRSRRRLRCPRLPPPRGPPQPRRARSPPPPAPAPRHARHRHRRPPRPFLMLRPRGGAAARPWWRCSWSALSGARSRWRGCTAGARTSRPRARRRRGRRAGAPRRRGRRGGRREPGCARRRGHDPGGRWAGRAGRGRRHGLGRQR